jgi:hypothetical protein
MIAGLLAKRWRGDLRLRGAWAVGRTSVGVENGPTPLRPASCPHRVSLFSSVLVQISRFSCSDVIYAHSPVDG